MDRYRRLVFVLIASTLLGSCGSGGLPEVPDDAKGTAEAVISNLVENKPGIIWSALPASYKADLNDLARSTVRVISKDLYEDSVGLLRQANKILKEKKSFVLKSSQLGLMANDLEEVSKNWDAITQWFDILLDSQLGSFETAKNFDGGVWLAETGADLMEHMVTISALTSEDPWKNEILPNLKAITVKQISSSAGKTILEFIGDDGQKNTETFVKVEEKWIPASMQLEWMNMMQNAKAQIPTESDMLPARITTRMMIGFAKGVLNQLDAATSEEEFLKVLESLGNFDAF
ncbi:MAG: hypothetical protein CMI31_04920 [Opitutae bacterium]|nr:hypothetical protein [Opitutae bacterium]|tara:strand:+ start:1755 stop:2621 length:867 start_codon:yes stop_codon:yes gene_type:complete